MHRHGNSKNACKNACWKSKRLWKINWLMDTFSFAKTSKLLRLEYLAID